jgi:hypothetical protein
MSLKLIKNNTSSPFHLQRSIVPQGDEDGAYARGGFNPDALYNLDAANAAVESIGTTVGAALSSRSKKEDAKAEKNTDKGLEDFKKITSAADKKDKEQKSKDQETRLQNIADDFDAMEASDAFNQSYKKYSRRGI